MLYLIDKNKYIQYNIKIHAGYNNGYNVNYSTIS